MPSTRNPDSAVNVGPGRLPAGTVTASALTFNAGASDNAALQAHITDPIDAHMASAIGQLGFTGETWSISPNGVQSALDKLFEGTNARIAWVLDANPANTADFVGPNALINAVAAIVPGTRAQLYLRPGTYNWDDAVSLIHVTIIGSASPNGLDRSTIANPAGNLRLGFGCTLKNVHVLLSGEFRLLGSFGIGVHRLEDILLEATGDIRVDSILNTLEKVSWVGPPSYLRIAFGYNFLKDVFVNQVRIASSALGYIHSQNLGIGGSSKYPTDPALWVGSGGSNSSFDQVNIESDVTGTVMQVDCSNTSFQEVRIDTDSAGTYILDVLGSHNEFSNVLVSGSANPTSGFVRILDTDTRIEGLEIQGLDITGVVAPLVDIQTTRNVLSSVRLFGLTGASVSSAIQVGGSENTLTDVEVNGASVAASVIDLTGTHNTLSQVLVTGCSTATGALWDTGSGNNSISDLTISGGTVTGTGSSVAAFNADNTSVRGLRITGTTITGISHIIRMEGQRCMLTNIHMDAFVGAPSASANYLNISGRHNNLACVKINGVTNTSHTVFISSFGLFNEISQLHLDNIVTASSVVRVDGTGNVLDGVRVEDQASSTLDVVVLFGSDNEVRALRIEDATNHSLSLVRANGTNNRFKGVALTNVSAPVSSITSRLIVVDGTSCTVSDIRMDTVEARAPLVYVSGSNNCVDEVVMTSISAVPATVTFRGVEFDSAVNSVVRGIYFHTSPSLITNDPLFNILGATNCRLERVRLNLLGTTGDLFKFGTVAGFTLSDISIANGNGTSPSLIDVDTDVAKNITIERVIVTGQSTTSNTVALYIHGSAVDYGSSIVVRDCRFNSISGSTTNNISISSCGVEIVFENVYSDNAINGGRAFSIIGSRSYIARNCVFYAGNGQCVTSTNSGATYISTRIIGAGTSPAAGAQLFGGYGHLGTYEESPLVLRDCVMEYGSSNCNPTAAGASVPVVLFGGFGSTLVPGSGRYTIDGLVVVAGSSVTNQHRDDLVYFYAAYGAARTSTVRNLTVDTKDLQWSASGTSRSIGGSDAAVVTLDGDSSNPKTLVVQNLRIHNLREPSFGPDARLALKALYAHLYEVSIEGPSGAHGTDGFASSSLVNLHQCKSEDVGLFGDSQVIMNNATSSYISVTGGSLTRGNLTSVQASTSVQHLLYAFNGAVITQFIGTHFAGTLSSAIIRADLLCKLINCSGSSSAAGFAQPVFSIDNQSEITHCRSFGTTTSTHIVADSDCLVGWNRIVANASIAVEGISVGDGSICTNNLIWLNDSTQLDGIVSVGGGNRVIISNNYVENRGSGGISIRATTGQKMITNNMLVCSGSGDAARIDLTNCHDSIISGNRLDNTHGSNGQASILASGSDGCANTVISSNVLTCTNDGGYYPRIVAERTDGLNHVIGIVIQGNALTNFDGTDGRVWIYVEWTDSATIQGNTLHGNTTTSLVQILIDSNAIHTIVMGNTLRDEGTGTGSISDSGSATIKNTGDAGGLYNILG